MLTHSHRWHGLFTKLFRKSSCRQGAVQGLYGIRWKWEEILAGVSGPESSPNSLRESCMRLGKSLPLFQTWFLLQLNEVYITNHLHLMILWTGILELAQTLILFINSIITIWLIVLSRSLWPAEPRLAFGLWPLLWLAMFAGNSVSLFHRLVCILGQMSPFLIIELLKLCQHMSSRGCCSYSSRGYHPWELACHFGLIDPLTSPAQGACVKMYACLAVWGLVPWLCFHGP